jgi:hypothetical protein
MLHPGVLADNQRAVYQVTVPASVAGAPVLGWKLDLTALNGTPSVRVRQNYLPDDNFTATTALRHSSRSPRLSSRPT